MVKVKDIIGDTYKEWENGIYLIHAPTGTGKTMFVLNELYEYVWAQKKKMAFLVNRSILKDQLLANLKGREIQIYTYQKIEHNNTIKDVMHLFGLWDYKVEDLVSELNQYDYLVMDEAHYIFQDAIFNRNTDTVLQVLEQYHGTVLMMTATPQILKYYFDQRIKKEYFLKPDYSFIKEIIVYQKDEEKNLINSIPKDEKILFFGSNINKLIRLSRQYPTESDYICKDNKKESHSIQEIIQDNQFSTRMLFSTEVLDNGVNLLDDKLKHIFLDLPDIITIVQCLGRKRIQQDEKITVYFRYRGRDSFSSVYNQQKKDEQIWRLFHDCEMYLGMEDFKQLYCRKDLPKFIDNNYNIIIPALQKFLYDFHFVKSIMTERTTLLNEVITALGNPPVRKYKNISLCEFLEQNQNIPFYKEDRKLIWDAMAMKRNGKKLKSLRVFNAYLQEEKIPFTIVSGKERSRQSPHRDCAFWIIKKFN